MVRAIAGVLFAATILVGQALDGHAATITRCGESTGWAWFFAGPAVPSTSAGWQKDAITNGDISLIFDGQEPDIVTTDTAGTRSVRAAGATTMALPGAPGFTLILVVYPAGAVEHYLFRLDDKGRGSVVWGTSRSGGTIQKSSLMAAQCRTP